MTDAASTAAAGTGSPDPAAGFIDVHHHITPPAWAEGARAAIAATIRRTDLLLEWTPQRSIEEMDRNGIATAVTSLTNPGVWFGDPQVARSLARASNEYAANLARDFRGRFGVFAALPLPDRDGSLEEIAYAFEVLQANGIGLMTSYGDKWPGDPAFAEVFDELNRRKAVIYLHPTVPKCCSALIPGVSPSVVEFPIDTTRAVTSLLFSGTFARCPDIRWIFSHGGAAVPMVAHRMAHILEADPRNAAKAPQGVLHELRRLYYDTAQAANLPAMSALLALTGVSQVLFGSDYPLLGVSHTKNGLASLGLASGDVAAIGRDNALRLFPRLGRQ
jgi:predicted TIM-barrel fold metal-dependent hydrolase